jgi:ankyrin repeat protein
VACSKILRACFAAALAGDEMALRAATEAGDDVNGWNDLGMTPLLYAVFRGDLDAVRLLLDAGADPNRPQRGDPTATPLWHARDDLGLHEIAKLLEARGARATL